MFLFSNQQPRALTHEAVNSNCQQDLTISSFNRRELERHSQTPPSLRPTSWQLPRLSSQSTQTWSCSRASSLTPPSNSPPQRRQRTSCGFQTTLKISGRSRLGTWLYVFAILLLSEIPLGWKASSCGVHVVPTTITYPIVIHYMFEQWFIQDYPLLVLQEGEIRHVPVL